MVWFRWWLWCSGRSPLCFLVRPHKLLTKPFKQPDPQIVSDIHFLYTVVCEFFLPKVLEICFFLFFFNGAFTSLGTRWSSHTMATQYWNWYFISVSSVCLWAVPKKINETFVSWDLVFCLSLSAAASYMPGMPAVSPYGPNPNSG